MSATSIEWTHRPGTTGEVWNIVTGCNKVDRGCKNCYAEIMHARLQHIMPKKYDHDFLTGAHMHTDLLELPFTWKKPRTVFVNSMSDLFHKDVPFEFIAQVFQVMNKAEQHTFLILTKRPEQAVEFWKWSKAMTKGWRCPFNVWIGTSANDQASADKRIPQLMELTGCLRFLSYEPATGPINLREIGGADESWTMDVLAGTGYADGNIYRDEPRLHWVIMGGESGNKAEPMHPAWVRKVRDDCRQTGVPFFFKQWGGWQPITYRKDDQTVHIKFQLGKNEYLFTDPPQNMVKVGKHASGHELDGVVYQQFPDTQPTKS